jgi:hypothetical protein
MWWLNYVTAVPCEALPSPAPHDELCYQGYRQDDEKEQRNQSNDRPNQEENDLFCDIYAV